MAAYLPEEGRPAYSQGPHNSESDPRTYNVFAKTWRTRAQGRKTPVSPTVWEEMIRNRRLETGLEIERIIPSNDGQECIVDSCAQGPGSQLSRLQQDLLPRDPDLLGHKKLLEQPDLQSQRSIQFNPATRMINRGDMPSLLFSA